jgi:DeoR/GlpR family transcriptional regulator of sugar metabolism
MLRTERQAKILELIRQKGFIHNEDLAQTLKVSIVTIRRDLKELSKQRLLTLEHGGATSIDYLEGVPEPQYETKMFVNALQKQAIAKEALKEIKDGDSIIIDSGTTCLHLAKLLKREKFNKLTVITNDIMVARELGPNSNITVIILGGILRKSYYNAYGHFTELILSNLKANKYFYAFDGFTADRGFSNTVLEEIPIKQKMIEISDQVIALCDSSKFGLGAPYIICGLEKIQKVITDEGIEKNQKDVFLNKGIEIIVAEMQPNLK